MAALVCELFDVHRAKNWRRAHHVSPNLLKIASPRGGDAGPWWSTVHEQSNEMRRRIAASPSLFGAVPAMIDKSYSAARSMALLHTGVPIAEARRRTHSHEQVPDEIRRNAIAAATEGSELDLAGGPFANGDRE